MVCNYSFLLHNNINLFPIRTTILLANRQSLQQNFFRSICTDVLGILVEVAEPEWVPFSNQPKPNLRRNITIKDARFAFPILNTLQLRLNHLILYNATYIR